MRKFFSILLLALFGLPVAAPVLALGQTHESRLPACCRRAGDHHCAANMAAQMEMASVQPDDQASPNPRLSPPTPHCPYTPSTLPIQHLNPGVRAVDASLQPHLQSQHFVATQTLTGTRTIDDPSRPKRGPPSTNS